MSTQKKYPFKFLDAYSREDQDIFFGRDEEVAELYQMVFQTDLILIYGASGTGKTSLIQCGLAGKFQPYEWLALSIRRGENLNESLDKALADPQDSNSSAPAADNLDWLDDATTAPNPSPTSPVAQNLKSLYLRHFKPIFLIFDQFEELYILGSREEQNTFVEAVREILRSEQPVKIILSIREEYLGYLYEFEKKVPALLRKKLRIEPMNLEKVQSVVRGIGRLPQSNVHIEAGQEEKIGEGIFEKLKGREHTRTIELPYLQVFLDKLYFNITKDTNRQADAVITLSAFRAIKVGHVLRDFLDEQVQQNARTLQTTPETIKKLLTPFVTLDGTKDPLSAAQLHARVTGLAPDFVAHSLQAFQNSRILRFDEKEQRYEVAHDSLARQIATYQDAEDVALQKAAQMIRTQLLMEVEKREVFSEKQLLFIEPYLGKLNPGQMEMDWIERSSQYWQQAQNAEAAREREELEKAQKQAVRERGMRERAERNEQKTRQRTRVAAVLALLALVGLIFAWSQYRAANSEREIALRAQLMALQQKQKAEKNEQKADSLRQIAFYSDSLARKAAAKAEAALQRQLEAERNTKHQQIQTYLTQASDFRNRKQYVDAIKSYQNALALTDDIKSKKDIQFNLNECQDDNRDNDFKVAKERGLRLVAVGECKAASKYLKAALNIRKDPDLEEALKKCQ